VVAKWLSSSGIMPFSFYSAGIGRTGVFICFDIGMRQLRETNEVDILQIASMLRQDRGGMVQTLSQYHFIYKVSSRAH